MKPIILSHLICLVLPAGARKKKETPPVINPKPVPDSLFDGLKWRNIGPFRGSRANAVSGAVKNDQKFYAGYTEMAYG